MGWYRGGCGGRNRERPIVKGRRLNNGGVSGWRVCGAGERREDRGSVWWREKRQRPLPP